MEPKPSIPGSAYGQKSPQGQWMWNGTGRVDDAWVWVGPAAQPAALEAVTPQAAPPYQQLPLSTRPWEVGPIAGSPFPASTFPAGHYLDGMGTIITPTRVASGWGN